MKRLHVAALLAGALFLNGCANTNSEGSSNGLGFTNPTSGNLNPGGGAPPPATFRPLFQLAQGLIPYPIDLYFSGTTDLTLNLPTNNPLMPNAAAINALDGFSTVAPIRVRFDGAVNAASLTAATVRVIQVNVDNATKATVGVVRPLALGTDFSVGLPADAGGTTLEIRPLRPLVPSTGTTNNGYLVLLTNGITNAAGAAANPDGDYAAIKAALPTCASITNATLNGVCRLTGAHMQIAQALGINPANVVVSFSFSTQSTRDTMNILAATSVAGPIVAQPTGLTTRQVLPQPPTGPPVGGRASVYVGTLQVPYYLSRPSAADPTAPLTKFWLGNPSPLDATSRLLTRLNPVPVATTTVTIPLLLAVPNEASAFGGVKPPTGWPVAIFQHGITGNRTNMLPIADAFANAGFVVAAIDIPLHGLTSATNPFYQQANERTFNVDYVNNTTSAAGPDGVIDSSGTHMINLSSLLTSRDNLRQGEADVLVLAKSLANLDFDGVAGADINPARIHFVGHSLGGIIGAVAHSLSPNIRTATLAMPGGGIAELLRDSVSFGPRIAAGLAAGSGGLIAPGTTAYALFFRDAQTAVDAGDPINFVSPANPKPVHLIQVIGGGAVLPDQVVPNSATARLISAAGLIRALPPGSIIPTGHRAYVNYIGGDHGSIVNPQASLAATAAMQRATVTFAASDGLSLDIADTTVIQP